MKTTPRVGREHEKTWTVDASKSIDLAPAKLPAVLATPWLIWFLEVTSLELVQPQLDDDELTVGVEVEIEHLAPTPVGEEVTCRARLVHADGPLLSFHVEARDRHELIARGLHKRRVVAIEKLAARVQRKSDR
jgi:predicted thioesterase